MNMSWQRCALALGLLAGTVSPAQAQCRPADAKASYAVSRVKVFASATDSHYVAIRDRLKITPPDRNGVFQVTKAATCKSANTAYQTAAAGDRSSFSGQVYVIQSGKSFVVWDPSYRYVPGGDDLFMVFDSQWALKSKF
jgi:hypothetical protein